MARAAHTLRGKEGVIITVRRSGERGHAEHGWLDSRHTFSFAGYYDPSHMGFRALRVINEDRVAAGKGFDRHSHRDMEIISYVLSGGLEHRDSMGTGTVIRPGDVQRMSAGTGVTHSEFNASTRDPVHFLQIWLLPDKRGIAPSYEQKSFSQDDKAGRLRLVASRDGHDDSVRIHTDAALWAGVFGSGQTAEHSLAPGRHAWVHLVRGKARINDIELTAGDAVALSEERTVRIEGIDDAELLVFDLA
ncbi:MAG TPA: pirin family protein [Kofleriaceae bacterium]|nr:pirin family protein [Kofleriaceae bacterium]